MRVPIWHGAAESGHFTGHDRLIADRILDASSRANRAPAERHSRRFFAAGNILSEQACRPLA